MAYVGMVFNPLPDRERVFESLPKPGETMKARYVSDLHSLEQIGLLLRSQGAQVGLDRAQTWVAAPSRNRCPGRNGSLLERDHRQRRPGERVRLVQRQMAIVLADYANGSDESDHRSRFCCKARIRSDDADDKDRHRCNRGGAPRLSTVVEV